MDRKKYIAYLIILSLVYGALFFTLNVLKYRAFFSFEWEDDARENQVVYNIATTFNPHQTIVVSNYFSDHFTPIYFLIALFYRVYPDVHTWYFIMSFSYAFSSIIVYLLSRDILKDERIGFIISLSYILYSPLHYVNLGALDGNNFSLPLLFLTFYFLYKRKFILYILTVILSCMCKEDIPLIIFLLGIYQLIKRYPKKWWISTTVFSAIYFIISVYISNKFIRVEGFSSNVTNRSFEYFDLNTIAGILSFVSLNMKAAFEFIFSWSHIRVLIMILCPLILLPMFSSELYIPLVMFGEIFLSREFGNQDAYYLAPIIPFLFISLIGTLKKMSNHIFWKKSLFYIALLILLVCFLSNFGRNIIGCIAMEANAKVHDNRFIEVKNIFDSRIYTMDEEDKFAWELINTIPRDASVTASGDLLLALSSRNVLYEFGLNNPKAIRSKTFLNYPDYDVDYVIVHRRYMANGLGGHYAFLENEDLENEIKRFIDTHHFFIVEEEDNFILLKNSKLKMNYM